MLTLPTNFETRLTATTNGALIVSGVVVYETTPQGYADGIEQLSDSGLETWTDPSTPTYWNTVEDGSDTITREAAEQRSGTYCLALNKTVSSGALTRFSQTILGLSPGSWYHLTGYAKCSGASPSTGAFCNIINSTRSKLWFPPDTADPFSGTWDSFTYSGDSSHVLDVSTSWIRFSFWFKTDDAYPLTDAYEIRFGQTGTTDTETFYFDDISLIGPFESAGLYLSSQQISWNGDTYTRLVEAQSNIVETMGTRVPECRVTFSNVNNTLRSYLEPTDLITNRRMRIRLLLRNLSTGAFESGSVTLFYGFMQAPRRWDQNSLEITVVGLASGALAITPSRATDVPCSVHEFADGTDCLYTSTTTANGAGAASTALTVADGSNLVDGQYITIGSGDEVLIDSGGGTTSITLAEARTWADTDAVAYSRCDRSYTSCGYRGRQHEYQGFRGRKNEQLVRLWRYWTTSAPWKIRGRLPAGSIWHRTKYGGTVAYQTDTIGDSESLSDHSRYIPVGLGRRLVDLNPNMIEEASFQYSGDTDGRTFLARFYALGEGEISAINEWYNEEDIGDEVPPPADPDPNVAKTFGMYWRPGTIGTDDDETEAEYIADATTKERAQNRDWTSTANDPLSRTAYLLLIQETTENNDNDKIPNPSADVSFLLIQKYTDDDTPTTTGSPVWTSNPIWQATALMLDRRFGAGRWVTESDIDFTVTQPAAVYCDTTVSGPIATVTAAATSTTYTVDSTQDFQRGMTVEVDNGTPSNSTCTRVLSDTEIELADAIAVSVDDILTAKLPRYSCNLILDQPEQTSDQVAKILRHCFGYITADVDGRIQFRVEQTGSSVATFKDTGYADGYGIIEDSFELLSPQEGRHASTTNRVFASFVDQDNVSDDARSDDEDNIATFGPVPEKLDFDGIDNPHTARQMATTHRKLRRSLGNGARFTVGPIGVKIQCGNIVSVTHSVPNWTAADKRVTRVEKIGLGSDDDMLVRLTVEDYQAAPYTDITGEQREMAGVTLPTVTLTVDTAANGVVILTWSWSGGNAPIKGWGIFKSTATHGGAPSLSTRIYSSQYVSTPHLTQRRYVYTANDAEIGDTLYFVVRANCPPRAAALSNEVTAVPVDADPTSTQFQPGENTLYGGEFDVPGNWIPFTVPSGTDVSPELVTTVSGAWTDTGYAIDDDTSTTNAATAVCNTGATQTRHCKFTFDVTTGATTGYWRVYAKIQDNSGGSSGYLRLINDTVAPENVFMMLTKAYGTVPTWGQSDPFDTNYEDLTCHAYARTNEAQDLTASIYEVYWYDLSGGAMSNVSGNIGSIRGDGSSTYGELRRPWPDQWGSNEVVVPSGSEWTATARFRYSSSAPSHDVLVQLYDIEADTYYTLMTVDKDDLTGSFQGFSLDWTAPSALTGPFEFVIRTLGDTIVNVDKAQFVFGNKVTSFSFHRDEVGKVLDNSYGVERGYTRGPSSGTPRISAVS